MNLTTTSTEFELGDTRRTIARVNSRSHTDGSVRRLVILVGLCLAASLLVVGFGAQFNGTDAYPDATAIDADYDAHVGEAVHIWGEVTATDGRRVVVTADTLSLRVTEPAAGEVAVGDQIQVYGRLAPDRQLLTTAYDVQSPDALRSMYAVSIVGITLAAGSFLRRWRVDTDRWAFAPREGE